MARHHSDGQFRKTKVSTKSLEFPNVYVDRENDFATIRLAPGIESKAYKKGGFIFCEDRRGKIIEIQLLSLKGLSKKSRKKSV